MSKTIVTVVGTRPNLIKITQFQRVVSLYAGWNHVLVHTGQHFDKNMNDVFFEELNLQYPDFSLQPDKSSVVAQLASIMTGLEKIFNEIKPDMVMVVGDVNSTLAASLVANKMNLPFCHVESGLRSFDRSMPEEHNRMVTDVLADYYFVTESDGLKHLLMEGKKEENIFFVGNTMIDTLVAFDDTIRASTVIQKLGLEESKFILMTMHRPGNVDSAEGLTKVVELLEALVKDWKIVFPVHPRTLNNCKAFGLYDRLASLSNVILMEPAGYIDFQKLILHASVVITDSGGIQEETTFRQVPCITLRPNTERPVTVTIGSNVLLTFDHAVILETIESIKKGTFKRGQIPPFWDGKATERIFECLAKLLNS